MTPKFLISIEFVLEHEGGYSNNPNDPGGETNYGITENTIEHIGYGKHVDEITVGDAKKIYYEHWWKAYNYEMLCQGVATKVFDMSVNMGPTRPHKALQRVLNNLGCDIKVDGLIGPNTALAANSCNEEYIMIELRHEAAKIYRHLIESNPSLEEFKRGWFSRAYS